MRRTSIDIVRGRGFFAANEIEFLASSPVRLIRHFGARFPQPDAGEGYELVAGFENRKAGSFTGMYILGPQERIGRTGLSSVAFASASIRHAPRPHI